MTEPADQPMWERDVEDEREALPPPPPPPPPPPSLSIARHEPLEDDQDTDQDFDQDTDLAQTWRWPEGTRTHGPLPAQARLLGGVDLGATFAGWLVAASMTVLLVSVRSGLDAALGLDPDRSRVGAAIEWESDAVGLLSRVTLMVVMFISYSAGGYVAGRMARVEGLRQGVVVWMWAGVASMAVTLLAMTFTVAGPVPEAAPEWLDGVVRLAPVDGSQLGPAGVLTLFALGLTSLAGAMLGGIRGTRPRLRARDRG